MTCTCSAAMPSATADHLLGVAADDDLAVVAPRPARGIGGGQHLELALDLGHGLAGELLGGP